ncbi:hypothetical protein TNCV_324471 [Trichonephila clavipes]|nr:hypothetical protein TNCV_324471 [Trichonephila clavipes]
MVLCIRKSIVQLWGWKRYSKSKYTKDDIIKDVLKVAYINLCGRVLKTDGGHGSLVVKVLNRGWLVTSSSPVSLMTHLVGERCKLNLSRAKTSSRCCDVIVRRCQLRCHPHPLTMDQNDEVRRQKPSCS